MSQLKPSFSLNVDTTNPGQFFACCGLLELADRRWPGAAGWFTSGEFHVACDGTLSELLSALCASQLTSSLGDDGLKRLGTLLSAAKSSLTATDKADKERLRAAWQVERITVSAPFHLALNWWWDERSGVTLLKTWAAKQFALYILRPLLDAIRPLTWEDRTLAGCLSRPAKLKGLTFCFDSANNSQATPRDTGFAPGTVKAAVNDRPLIELLAFVGIQRFRPDRPERSDLIRYTPWTIPLPPSVAGAVASGLLRFPDDTVYEFRMLYRSEYMKAFLPAQLSQEVSR